MNNEKQREPAARGIVNPKEEDSDQSRGVADEDRPYALTLDEVQDEDRHDLVSMYDVPVVAHDGGWKVLDALHDEDELLGAAEALIAAARGR